MHARPHARADALTESLCAPPSKLLPAYWSASEDPRNHTSNLLVRGHGRGGGGGLASGRQYGSVRHKRAPGAEQRPQSQSQPQSQSHPHSARAGDGGEAGGGGGGGVAGLERALLPLGAKLTNLAGSAPRVSGSASLFDASGGVPLLPRSHSSATAPESARSQGRGQPSSRAGTAAAPTAAAAALPAEEDLSTSTRETPLFLASIESAAEQVAHARHVRVAQQAIAQLATTVTQSLGLASEGAAATVGGGGGGGAGAGASPASSSAADPLLQHVEAQVQAQTRLGLAGARSLLGGRGRWSQALTKQLLHWNTLSFGGHGQPASPILANAPGVGLRAGFGQDRELEAEPEHAHQRKGAKAARDAHAHAQPEQRGSEAAAMLRAGGEQDSRGTSQSRAASASAPASAQTERSERGLGVPLSSASGPAHGSTPLTAGAGGSVGAPHPASVHESASLHLHPPRFVRPVFKRSFLDGGGGCGEPAGDASQREQHLAAGQQQRPQPAALTARVSSGRESNLAQAAEQQQQQQYPFGGPSVAATARPYRNLVGKGAGALPPGEGARANRFWRMANAGAGAAAGAGAGTAAAAGAEAGPAAGKVLQRVDLVRQLFQRNRAEAGAAHGRGGGAPVAAAAAATASNPSSASITAATTQQRKRFVRADDDDGDGDDDAVGLEAWARVNRKRPDAADARSDGGGRDGGEQGVDADADADTDFPSARGGGGRVRGPALQLPDASFASHPYREQSLSGHNWPSRTYADLATYIPFTVLGSRRAHMQTAAANRGDGESPGSLVSSAAVSLSNHREARLQHVIKEGTEMPLLLRR